MPFYEGIGLIAEKNAVVLDLGSAYTKVGYAGEASPRAILSTPVEVARLAQGPASDRDALYAALVPFVHTIYFTHLLVNPKDRRIVIADALLGPIKMKEVLSEVLFKHFEVLSILYAPSHLMPLFTLGIQTGIVLDVGFAETTLIPVYEGVPILKAWQAQPLASEAIHKEIVEMLKTRGTIKTGGDQVQKVSEVEGVCDILDSLAEDIKIRLCFVTNLKRGQQIQKIRADASSVSGLSSFLKRAVPTATYPIGGNYILHVDGSVRESVCEVMFEQDADCLSISTMILDAILACPIDTRRDLAKNIIIVGGTSMLVGFKARLFEELRFLLDHTPPYKEKLSIEELKLHTPPTKANYTCWTGASIFGATDAICTRSYTREMFLKEGGAVPDWSNLRFNSLFTGTDDRQG